MTPNPYPNPYPNPKKYLSQSSNPNAPFAPEAHLNADLAGAMNAKARVDFSDPTAAAVGTLKRPREEDDADAGTSADVPEAKQRVKASHDVIYRIVVPSRQIGKVIGRAGHRIQKIREDAKATIKKLLTLSRIIISSKDSDNVFSDAENANALHQIEDDGNVEAANAVRLLIAGSQAGGLIGVSGQNIVNLRKTSGATITVLPAHESDRVVQVSRDIPAVLRAVVEIGCQLRDNPPRQVISISTTNNNGFPRQPQSYVDPTSADYITLELMVPENLVGGLIGRFGANISRIRND